MRNIFNSSDCTFADLINPEDIEPVFEASDGLYYTYHDGKIFVCKNAFDFKAEWLPVGDTDVEKLKILKFSFLFGN